MASTISKSLISTIHRLLSLLIYVPSLSKITISIITGFLLLTVVFRLKCLRKWRFGCFDKNVRRMRSFLINKCCTCAIGVVRISTQIYKRNRWDSKRILLPNLLKVWAFYFRDILWNMKKRYWYFKWDDWSPTTCWRLYM